MPDSKKLVYVGARAARTVSGPTNTIYRMKIGKPFAVANADDAIFLLKLSERGAAAVREWTKKDQKALEEKQNTAKQAYAAFQVRVAALKKQAAQADLTAADKAIQASEGSAKNQ